VERIKLRDVTEANYIQKQWEGRSIWTLEEPMMFACKECILERVPCINYNGKLLPLHPLFRNTADKRDKSYYINGEITEKELDESGLYPKNPSISFVGFGGDTMNTIGNFSSIDGKGGLPF
jgi:hypothetical protein